MTDKKPPTDVAASVTRQGRDMQRVNDKLRDLIGSLQSSRDRLTEARAATAAEAPSTTAAAMPAVTPPRSFETRRLEAELAQAREQLALAADEREALRVSLASLEAEHRRVCDQFVESEGQTSELVQLFATLQQIHGAAGLEELLQALQEVVINVVGSEELAIFVLRDGALHLARSFGVDPEPLRRIPLGEGTIGRAAQAGTLYVAGRGGPPEDDRLTACLPLMANGAVVGAIAIFRLLGHKPGLTPADQALFDLLVQHAGQALRLRTMAH
jgi:GAF domain